MMKCWQEEPSKRPTFTELREELENTISDGDLYCSLEVDESCNYYSTPSFNSLPREEEDEAAIIEELMKKPMVLKRLENSRNRIQNLKKRVLEFIKSKHVSDICF